MYKKAYTFNDITLADIPSNILPTDACITANVTRDIQIKKPIISAAMDTVTEAEMAVAMAKNGGLGVLHRNLSIDEQVEQLMWVRRQVHNGGKIERPITFLDTDTVAELQHSVRAGDWRFTSFPIVDGRGVLVGMVTKDELSFVDTTNPTMREIMKPIDDLVTAPKPINPDEAFEIMIEKRVKKLPLVDVDGKLSGMYVWADVRRDKETRGEFSLDSDGRLLVAGAVGPTDYKRVDALAKAGCQILVVDCSHGACKSVLDILNYIQKNYNIAVIAGNIASYDSARYLLGSETPPDALKVGIGPGTICTTRRVTGHGVPQVTAISEVRRACQDLQISIPIIADGGITCSGDIVKALAVGANCVMLGGMLAGTDESPGDIITRDNKKYKNYRGMGSRAAMSERSGSRDRYFKSERVNNGERVTVQQAQKITPEGIEAMVEYKGPVGAILEELCGGIRSGMAHSNARTIGELQTNAVIWEQTMSGYVEGNPHNVIV